MATLAELRALVTLIVQDASFTTTIIDGYLNDGVAEIAGGMESTLGSFITPPLPNLFSIDTVDTVTDAAYVALPTTFGRALKLVSDSNGREIDIANSMVEFVEVYPLLDASGSVKEVIDYGGNIYYQGIPTSAEELTLYFHRLPVNMSGVSDTPDGIPLALQKKLLVNYACKEIFAVIEDGIDEEQQVNTIKYTKLFLISLRLLELSIPYDTRSFIR